MINLIVIALANKMYGIRSGVNRQKANKILLLGGSIDLNELPEEACIHEAQEEAGIKISLYNPMNNQLKNSCELVVEDLLINPMHTILGQIN